MLSGYFEYTPESGVLKYKKTGRIASSAVADRGGKRYVRVYCQGKRYKAHRIAMILMGVDLKSGDQVDHIDGDSLNNKASNLRVVSNAENAKNQKIFKNNKSGLHGVYFKRQCNKWHASITCKPNRIHIGYFSDFFEACCARKSIENSLGFHSNHGSR